MMQTRLYCLIKPEVDLPDGWDPLVTPISVGEGSHSRIGVAWLRHAFPGQVAPTAVDLLNVALAVYSADKRVRRVGTRDGWSRTIRLNLPVAEPALWDSAEVKAPLTRLLRYLTSDTWHLEFREEAHAWPFEPFMAPPSRRVALFSGGLDSLCFAANPPVSTTLVSHCPRNSLSPLQRGLAGILGYEDWRHVQLNTQTVADGRRNELSSRTRGLLFMALGLVVCSAHLVDRLFVPENGLMAVNLPLTPARIGACSTRSVHPWALALLNEVLGGLGLACRVSNPVADLTKGEMCRLALSRDGVTSRALADSVSCGKPYAYGGDPYGNCGYCYPCLVRHASLKEAGEDLTEYRISPEALKAGAGEQTEQADLAALRTWLARPDPTEYDLIAASPWPRGADLTAHLAVIVRGRRELRAAWCR